MYICMCICICICVCAYVYVYISICICINVVIGTERKENSFLTLVAFFRLKTTFVSPIDSLSTAGDTIFFLKVNTPKVWTNKFDAKKKNTERK